MLERVPFPSSTLVLGGARSGKSAHAQALAEASGLDRVFVATAHAYDDEMVGRIARHVAARDATWRTIDAPYDLVDALAGHAAPARVLLVDCLTLWLSNLMLRGDDPAKAEATLTERVYRLAGPTILVSNEVGAGIVPETPLGRSFRDAQGRLNQAMAAACDAVVLVTAGLPRQLKPAPTPAIVMASL